jgi:hypothetical protein
VPERLDEPSDPEFDDVMSRESSSPAGGHGATATPAAEERPWKEWPPDAVTLCRLFCFAAGPFLLLDGLAGLIFAPTAFSTGDHLPSKEWNFVFHFNAWHHLLHVVNGIVLTAGAVRRSWAPAAALLFGAAYAVMAPVGFIDGNDIFNLFYSSTRENLVHAAFAALGVALGLLGLKSRRRASRGRAQIHHVGPRG